MDHINMNIGDPLIRVNIRPSQVIRELIENSLDANSTKVKIFVKEGGLKLIQIEDNGCGIRKDDLETVCERFTTSKLREFNDLKMSTYGFRGEALANISQISHLTIISKTSHDMCAYKASYEDGKLKSEIEPIAGNQGCIITVENLFYNMPIRKKAFRKSNEYKKILEVVRHYAIHNFGTGFSLNKHGEHSNIRTPANSSVVNNIEIIYGNLISRQLIHFALENKHYKFKAEGSMTNANYSSEKMQFLLFVNHRPVFCQRLKRKIDQKYATYLPEKMHPFVYISLEIDPCKIDVIVHPTKHEVHFLNEEEIVDIITMAVNAELLGFINSREFYIQDTLPGAIRTYSRQQKIEEFFQSSVNKSKTSNLDVVENKESLFSILQENKPDDQEVTTISTAKEIPEKNTQIMKNVSEDVDITCSEYKDFSELNDNALTLEDENETALEKKLRLAKVYLDELKGAEKRKAESQEFDDARNSNIIQKRLKEDYFKQIGKLRKSVADKYNAVDKENIVVLKCKVQNSCCPTCLCISSDNNFIFSGSKGGIIVKWSIKEKMRCGFIPHVNQNSVSIKKGHSHNILSIAISFDDTYLAVGDESSTIQIWNPDDLTHIKSLNGHKGAITAVVFRNNTHMLYSASKDKSVRVWSLDEMTFVDVFFGHMDGITSIDALNTERVITSGGRDSSIRLWKIAEELQLIYNVDASNVDCVKLLNDDNFASGGDDGNLCIWGINKKKPLCITPSAHGFGKINNEPNWICSIASLANTDLLATGSCDGFVNLWKLEDKFKSVTSLFQIPVNGFVNSLSFTTNGEYLIAAVSTEHKFGRWHVIKSAKNSIMLFPLTQK